MEWGRGGNRQREEVDTELNYMDIHTRIILHACYLYGYGEG